MNQEPKVKDQVSESVTELRLRLMEIYILKERGGLLHKKGGRKKELISSVSNGP